MSESAMEHGQEGRIKRMLPRGLYGRAALILVLPIVTVLTLLSVVFLQRHYDGVAGQMTRNLAVSLGYLAREVAEAPDLAAAQARVRALEGPLALNVVLPAEAPPAGDRRGFDDLTGRAVIATLRSDLDGVRAVDLSDERRVVQLWLDTAHGPMLVALDRRRVSASNPHQLLVIVITAALLMTGIAFLFLRNQLRPIRQLAKAAEAFGRGERLAYRPRGASEVRLAGQAFLDMRERIERQIEERTLMLSGISHDLRTPLTRLKLGLALIEESAEVEALGEDVAEMERLVESFLDHVRGAATEAPAPVDVRALLQAAVEKAVRAGGAVELEEGPPLVVPLRAELMGRALDNLIGNALRYGRRCRVAVAKGHGTLRIAVEDDGPGIPAARRGEAVKPFARLDAARNQDRGSGVGLGLAIVADVARAHGGRLVLGDSRALGGLRAELVLPR